MENDLTLLQAQEKIDYYRHDRSELGREKYKYFKTLKRYIKAKEDKKLCDVIKQKLNEPHVSGYYNKKDTAKVLGITPGEVASIELKVIRMLKHPTKSRKIKRYLAI